MQFTNVYGIPQEVVEAIINDPYRHDSDISVTSLIGPPRIFQLRKRHQEEIVEDVSDRLFSLYGQVVHGILDRSSDFEAFHEERLSAEVSGWKISGATDLYKRKSTGAHVLRDYKFTSVYTSNYGVKPEWIAQVNLYAHLWQKHGFPVDAAQIVAIYRDWRKAEYERRDNGYPPPVQILKTPIWPADQAGKFLCERVAIHQAAEALPDDQLPPCTPEERWERGGKWALMKKGRKTAVKLYDSMEEAEAAMEGKKDHWVEERPARAVRCEMYCNVRDFCNQVDLEF